jgi:hypothetical protein
MGLQESSPADTISQTCDFCVGVMRENKARSLSVHFTGLSSSLNSGVFYTYIRIRQ